MRACASYLVMVTEKDNRHISWNFNLQPQCAITLDTARAHASLVMVTDRDNRPTSRDFNQAAAMREIELYSNTVIGRQCAPLYVHLPSISTAFYCSTSTVHQLSTALFTVPQLSANFYSLLPFTFHQPLFSTVPQPSTAPSSRELGAGLYTPDART
jgi:hypothetical protein